MDAGHPVLDAPRLVLEHAIKPVIAKHSLLELALHQEHHREAKELTTEQVQAVLLDALTEMDVLVAVPKHVRTHVVELAQVPVLEVVETPVEHQVATLVLDAVMDVQNQLEMCAVVAQVPVMVLVLVVVGALDVLAVRVAADVAVAVAVADVAQGATIHARQPVQVVTQTVMDNAKHRVMENALHHVQQHVLTDVLTVPGAQLLAQHPVKLQINYNRYDY